MIYGYLEVSYSRLDGLRPTKIVVPVTEKGSEEIVIPSGARINSVNFKHTETGYIQMSKIFSHNTTNVEDRVANIKQALENVDKLQNTINQLQKELDTERKLSQGWMDCYMKLANQREYSPFHNTYQTSSCLVSKSSRLQQDLDNEKQKLKNKDAYVKELQEVIDTLKKEKEKLKTEKDEAIKRAKNIDMYAEWIQSDAIRIRDEVKAPKTTATTYQWPSINRTFNTTYSGW